jgi:hypothetical protein
VLTAANKRLLIFESRGDLNRCTPFRRNPSNMPRASHTQSQTICISRGQRIATFCKSPIDLDGSHYSHEKGIPDYIPSMPADRSMGAHLVSLLLSTKEVVGLSQGSIDSRLLGLPDPYLRHAIGLFNTCSRGPTRRSSTGTGGGYNHVRALPGLRLSNLHISLQ